MGDRLMEEIEKAYFEDCLNNGSVATFTGKSLENLQVIIRKLDNPNWDAIQSYVEKANKAFDHTEVLDNLLFYIKKYLYQDESGLKRNLAKIVKAISAIIPIGEIYNYGYELEWQTCCVCGEIPEEEQTIKVYQGKNYIQIPVCKNCMEEEPNKDRVIDLMALRANALQNKYEHIIDPIIEEEVDEPDYLYKG
jgi:hypothetical protein